jgi:hypothetical protein
VLRVGLAVGTLALLVTAILTLATGTSATNPVYLVALVSVALAPDAYANVILGVVSATYHVGLAVLAAILLVAWYPDKIPAYQTILAGCIIGTMNALVAAPGMAYGGGITGLLFFVPLLLITALLVGILTWIAYSVTYGLARA